MKRSIAFLLIFITLLGLMGCKNSRQDICTSFLTYMQNGEYGEAYELLSSTCRNDSDEARSTRISKQEFIDKHTAIFEA
ncbi:MAG: hypothetical protein IJO48_01760, partial [Clostridia bacterium]|nr:hypothetical protein [Clostridia bacterium]